MAQLVARLVRNEKVGGSNPPSSTTSEVRPARKLAGRTFFDVAAAGSRRHDLSPCQGERCISSVQNFDLVSCRSFESGIVIEEYVHTIR